MSVHRALKELSFLEVERMDKGLAWGRRVQGAEADIWLELSLQEGKKERQAEGPCMPTESSGELLRVSVHCASPQRPLLGTGTST